MSKTLVFSAIGIVIIAVVFAMMTFFGGGENGSSDTPSNPAVIPSFPVGQNTPITVVNNEEIEIPLGNGTVSVKNFLRDPDVIADTANPGFYYIGAPEGLQYMSDQVFSIQYIAQTGHFTVTLQKKPLSTTRVQAETALKSRLGLSENEMCGLLYTVAVPALVDEEASGVDVRFSFCPDSQALPN